MRGRARITEPLQSCKLVRTSTILGSEAPPANAALFFEGKPTTNKRHGLEGETAAFPVEVSAKSSFTAEQASTRGWESVQARRTLRIDESPSAHSPHAAPQTKVKHTHKDHPRRA